MPYKTMGMKIECRLLRCASDLGTQFGVRVVGVSKHVPAEERKEENVCLEKTRGNLSADRYSALNSYLPAMGAYNI